MMTDHQCVEALRLADRLYSSDPDFDDCADAARVLRECVRLARMEPAATECRIATGDALRAAALDWPICGFVWDQQIAIANEICRRLNAGEDVSA